MSMFSRVAAFARSPAGRRLVTQAVRYARSPEGRKRIEQTRARVTARRRPRP